MGRSAWVARRRRAPLTRNYSDPTIYNTDSGFRVAASEAVPEPSGLAMLLAGAVAFGIWRKRRNAYALSFIPLALY